ncbi:MAG: response regulator [Elusimicrobiota bacterium]
MNNHGAVLVVDDDLSLRTLLSMSLRRAGYRAVTAASGAEALRVLASQPIEVLVTDGVMDVMDGIELSRRAKNLQPSLHIAMLSAVYVDHDVDGAPIERVFKKPNAVGDLMAWLQQIEARA